EGIGLIGRTLEERNIEVDYADLYCADAVLPDVAAYDALIFLGGPMSVNDDLPYLAREMEWIRQAVAQGRPILGICLGAQLIARALPQSGVPSRRPCIRSPVPSGGDTRYDRRLVLAE